MQKFYIVVFVMCLLSSFAFCGFRTLNVQTVIDYKSELVIAEDGVYWHNLRYDGAKPGNYGISYEITGPTYFDNVYWLPVWGNDLPRSEDVSNVYSFNTSEFIGFQLSDQYGGYFDNYPQLYSSGWGILGDGNVNLNRGIVYIGDYAGDLAVYIHDDFGGQNVYSFDLIFSIPMIPGDLNDDGFVGGEDLNIVLNNWGSVVNIGNLLKGDFHNDGFIDGIDLNGVLCNWGNCIPPTAIPEPSTVMFISIGFVLRIIKNRYLAQLVE